MNINKQYCFMQQEMGTQEYYRFFWKWKLIKILKTILTKQQFIMHVKTTDLNMSKLL